MRSDCLSLDFLSELKRHMASLQSLGAAQPICRSGGPMRSIRGRSRLAARTTTKAGLSSGSSAIGSPVGRRGAPRGDNAVATRVTTEAAAAAAPRGDGGAGGGKCEGRTWRDEAGAWLGLRPRSPARGDRDVRMREEVKRELRPHQEA